MRKQNTAELMYFIVSQDHMLGRI